jgi:IMP dehydrogenase/GMP reductase
MTWSDPMADRPPEAPGTPSSTAIVIAAWIAVGIPMLWGVMMTVKKAALLFK